MEFLDDGRITIDLEDGSDKITLNRPKYGAYKRFRLAVLAMSRDTSEALKKAQALDNDEAKEVATMEVDELATNRLVDLWSDIARTLGNRPLPEDVDQWPLDLLIGQNVVANTLEHWRTRPLARGEMGNEIPSTP
jgi:hypothetical protein